MNGDVFKPPKAAECRPPARDVLRLLSKIEPGPVFGDLGPCWVWTGHTTAKGYGQIKIGGRNGVVLYVHRVSFVTFNGPLQDGETVNHICANTSCINPDHLEGMSRSDNSTDANMRRWHGGDA